MSRARSGRRAAGRGAVQASGGVAVAELQKAITAHAAREQAAEYSDDFESDKDNMRNGVGEELNESYSSDESTKKSVAVERPLSDDDASQKAADLENEAVDDLSLSFHEKKFQQITLLDRKDGEEECLKSQNGGDDRKNNEECSAGEEVQRDNNETENVSIPSLDTCSRPTPRRRSMLKKSGPVEDRSERKITSRKEFSSVSASSSLTVKNAQATSKKNLLAKSPGVEGPCLESILPSYSINFTSQNERFGDSNLLMCGEAPPVKDEDQINTSDLKLEDKNRKPSPVTEAMVNAVDEETKKLEKSAEDSSDETVKTVEGQVVTDTIQEVLVNDQSEHWEAKSTSEDCIKKLSETKESVLQVRKASLSDRSLVSAHLKKKAKAVPSATPASSQHMGTLKVLEDKHVQKNSTEFNKADSLRAAVFQNWLEMKKHFLRESKRIEKEKAENLRNNIEKKEAIKREEAIASFEAWKRKKVREAKKLRQKKKLEELQKNETAEQNTDKSEAAQKAFEKWKEKKMEYLREQSRKEKQSDSRKKKKEEELVAQKKRDSMSAVEKWNEKKEEYIKQKKAEKIQERRKQEIQQAKKEEKNKKAMEEYEKWLGKVVMREQLEKKQKKLQAVRGCEMPSPWNPPGKVAY
ncbi:microtubule-associated protein 9-like [Amazona ochrocephala]